MIGNVITASMTGSQLAGYAAANDNHHIRIMWKPLKESDTDS
jgi:hypothetical protein